MTLFIADIGSNAQTLEQACQSIYSAKKAGADIVKFQLFSEFDLYGEGNKERKIESWLPKLAEVCKSLGVEFGCTAFSVEGLGIVDPFVKAHKIASSCATHKPLLTAAHLSGKDIFLSVGACTTAQVCDAVSYFNTPQANAKRRYLCVLYCPAAYPSRYCDVRSVSVLKSFLPWNVGVGFSDHTLDIYNAPRLAVKHAAEVIEKHFTAFPDMDTPDRGHSLTQDQFRAMVLGIKSAPSFGPTPEEQDFVDYHQVRFVDGRGYVRVRKP